MAGRNPIVVIAALPQELSGIRTHLTGESVSEEGGIRSFCGILGDKPIALVVSGVGTEKAAQASRLSIRRYAPRLVVSLGFAGGLTPEAGPGAIILPNNVVAADTSPADSGFRPDAGFLRLAQSAAQRIGSKALTGKLVTVSELVATKAAKEALRAQSGAIAVDMESTAVGQVCMELGVPVVFVRCVTDGAEDEIPVSKELSAAFRGRLKVVGLLLFLVRRPSVGIAIWRLYRQAHRASRTMSQLVRAFCEGLS